MNEKWFHSILNLRVNQICPLCMKFQPHLLYNLPGILKTITKPYAIPPKFHHLLQLLGLPCRRFLCSVISWAPWHSESAKVEFLEKELENSGVSNGIYTSYKLEYKIVILHNFDWVKRFYTSKVSFYCFTL